MVLCRGLSWIALGAFACFIALGAIDKLPKLTAILEQSEFDPSAFMEIVNEIDSAPYEQKDFLSLKPLPCLIFQIVKNGAATNFMSRRERYRCFPFCHVGRVKGIFGVGINIRCRHQ